MMSVLAGLSVADLHSSSPAVSLSLALSLSWSLSLLTSFGARMQSVMACKVAKLG